MVWPNNAPQRGKHWDIFFEPVMDSSNQQIPSTFVVVVTVIQCAGGVFTEKPESFRVVSGKLEEVPFEIWKKHISSEGDKGKTQTARSSSIHSSNLHR